MKRNGKSDKAVPLGDVAEPPAGKINPDYIQQPSNPRRCSTCSKWHDLIVENTSTGERLKEIDKCYDCFFEKAYSFKPVNEKISFAIN